MERIAEENSPHVPVGQPMSRRRSITLAAVAAVIATAIGIVLSYVIHWFPVQASTQARNTDQLYHVLVIATIPIFVLVVIGDPLLRLAVPDESRARSSRTDRRFTATRASRSSGRRCRRCCCWGWWATRSWSCTKTRKNHAACRKCRST